MNDDAEALLISNALKGNEAAFTTLVENYQTPVYHLCYRLLGGNTHDAEDAAQETFLRAYRGLSRYDPQRSFATWLLSIAAHYCIDRLRRQRMQLISLETFTGQILPDPNPSPETVTVSNEHQRRVQEMLATLSPTDRTAVVLHYWYDYSYEEIAETLSLTVSAVKSRLHRARRQLAQVWQENKATQPLTVEAQPHESPAF
ncbi:MAG: sigma-70 family RNA polymerase sigma factor [Anaerolineales bacterium]